MARIHRRTVQKRSSWPRESRWCDHWPRARHPSMWSQVGVRKHRYCKWWNSSWAISNPERWCCESAILNMPAILENSAVTTGLEKVSFILIPKKGNAKECSHYRTIALISHTDKVMHKILQARLQQYLNCELPDVQAGFWKGRGTRYQIANICWIIKEASEFGKNIYFCFTDLHQSLWLCGLQQTVENSLRDGNTRPPTCLLRNLYTG